MNRLKRAAIVCWAIAPTLAGAIGPQSSFNHMPLTFAGVGMYGAEEGIVTRWPDGPIRVYDETNFPYWDNVFKEMNPYLGKSSLQLVSDPREAQIRIVLGNPSQTISGACATTQPEMDNYKITSAKIVVDETHCSRAVSGRFVVYLHEIGHALGFIKHAPDGLDDVMSADVYTQAKAYPASLMKTFLRVTYSLPIGATYPNDEMKTIVSSWVQFPAAAAKTPPASEPVYVASKAKKARDTFSFAAILDPDARVIQPNLTNESAGKVIRPRNQSKEPSGYVDPNFAIPTVTVVSPRTSPEMDGDGTGSLHGPKVLMSPQPSIRIIRPATQQPAPVTTVRDIQPREIPQNPIASRTSDRQTLGRRGSTQGGLRIRKGENGESIITDK